MPVGLRLISLGIFDPSKKETRYSYINAPTLKVNNFKENNLMHTLNSKCTIILFVNLIWANVLYVISVFEALGFILLNIIQR